MLKTKTLRGDLSGIREEPGKTLGWVPDDRVFDLVVATERKTDNPR